MRIPQEVLFPPGVTSDDRARDALLTGALVFGAVVLYVPDVVHGYIGVLYIVLSLAMVLPLVLRRKSPLIALALTAIAGVLQLLFLSHPTPSLLTVPIVSYSVARWVPGRYSRAVIVIGGMGSLLGPLRWSPLISLDAFVMLVSASLAAVVTPYAVGRRWRELEESRRIQIEAAEERYQMLLAERERETALAEASARAVIARELHDIVAHSLSVIIVQAEGGRAYATKDPAAAVEALDTIGETGREALGEMRRIVGVLRGSDGRADYTPAPTMSDIPDLVARTSDKVTYTVEGTPKQLTPALELTIYRVVQEALTNFLKYAGTDASASVRITHEPNQVTVDIIDDGQGVTRDPSEHGGQGLRGMHERVTSMGGRLRVGPSPDAPGFRVTAQLPMRYTSPTGGSQP